MNRKQIMDLANQADNGCGDGEYLREAIVGFPAIERFAKLVLEKFCKSPQQAAKAPPPVDASQERGPWPVQRFNLDANIDGMDQLREFVLAKDFDRVVHELETNCDPAGMVRENAQLRDTNEGLQRMYRAALSSTPATVPDGYELVVVPKSQPGDEPDWDECLRQCEEATGIKVERHTLSIFIREVRRWLAHKASSATVQADREDAVLAYLDNLLDDAAVHIWPEDLEKCATSECVVEVTSVRMGSPEGKTLPLFSRAQVVDALRASTAAPGDSK